MTVATLEHLNITVADPDRTAAWLCDVFGWRVRWQGEVLGGTGRTVHVGEQGTYLAVYAGKTPPTEAAGRHYRIGALNHVGVVVDDLDAVEARVRAAGFKPHMHADYEPGRRFYFTDGDDIEFEVVSYAD